MDIDLTSHVHHAMERQMIRTQNVEHYEHVSSRPFDEVMGRFNAVTGTIEEGFGAVAGNATTPDDFKRIFEEREGSSGFMRFLVIDHGGWLDRFYDRPAKAVMVVLGNPLIAVTMLEHDLSVGLNVPVRIYIRESAKGGTLVTYDLPSSLMGDLPQKAREAAKKLDAKLIALATDIAGTDAI